MINCVEFDCVTNCACVLYVKCARFTLKDGRTVKLFRRHTKTFRYNSASIRMHWSDLYVSENGQELTDVEDSVFDDSVCDCLEIEDSAPVLYRIEAVNCLLNNKKIPVLG